MLAENNLQKLKNGSRAQWGYEVAFGILLLITADHFPYALLGTLVLWIFAWIALLLFIDFRERLLIVAGTLIGIFVVNGVGPTLLASSQYRPEELLARADTTEFKRFRPNQNATVERAHGDLAALGSMQIGIEAIREPRRLHYSVDAFGFRNPMPPLAPSEYALVLVGDSFVAGSGNSDAETLSAQIAALGLKNYAVAHNGTNIAEYIAAVRWWREQAGKAPATLNAKNIFFLYEGNDFSGSNYCAQSSAPIRHLRLARSQWKNATFPAIFAAITRTFAVVFGLSSNDRVVLAKLPGERSIGFLNEYLLAAAANAYDSQCLRALLTRERALFDLIVFIPDKARVYARWLPELPASLRGKSLYAEATAAIATELEIPFLDLTERLQREADSYLPSQQLIFWADDSHWNPRGIKAAAEEILFWWNREQEQAQK